MINSNKRVLIPKIFSFFLVEDEVDPENISKIFNEIFGSDGNYELRNARSVFSAVAKLHYWIEIGIYFNLYIYDVLLVEKEGKYHFPLAFPDKEFNEELNRFYGVDGFSSYSSYSNLELEVFNEFKKLPDTRTQLQKQGGLFLWKYNRKNSPKECRSLIYSASDTSAKSARWMNGSDRLHVLPKSLFDYSIIPDNYDTFLNEIERYSQNKQVKIFRDGEEIQHYEKFTQIPQYEGKFVDSKGEKINIHNHNISWNSHPDYLKISLKEKKKELKPKSDYENLLNILELCSEDILKDPDEYISWDNITDGDIDTLKNEGDLSGFFEKSLGVNNKGEYWTLRTLFPAQYYRIFNEHQDDLEAQKKKLKELIAEYSWNDYSEALSLFFNQGAVYIRAHSKDKHFLGENIESAVFSQGICNPFKKDEVISNSDIFKKVWEHQYNMLTLKIRGIDKYEFEHNALWEKKEEEKKGMTWQEIVGAFEKFDNPTIKTIRDNYLEYTRRNLFDGSNDSYFIKGTQIPVDFVGINPNKIKLFFPGTHFLRLIQDIYDDHKNGRVEKCIVTRKRLDRPNIVISFILIVRDFPGKAMTPDNSLTGKFLGNLLLKNFIRFNLILTNNRGEKQIFNINNKLFPMDPEIRKLKIKGETILDMKEYYADRDIDEIYVFSITSSEVLDEDGSS